MKNTKLMIAILAIVISIASIATSYALSNGFAVTAASESTPLSETKSRAVPSREALPATDLTEVPAPEPVSGTPANTEAVQTPTVAAPAPQEENAPSPTVIVPPATPAVAPAAAALPAAATPKPPVVAVPAAPVQAPAPAPAPAPPATPAPAPVAQDAYAQRVYAYVSNWCPNASIIVNHPSVVSGDVYGMTWWGTNKLAIRGDIPEVITKSIALHECGHILQARAYGYGNYNLAVARMSEIYGNVGMSGLEQNADCIAAYLSPMSHPAAVGANSQAAKWATRCGGAKGEAAKMIIQGLKP